MFRALQSIRAALSGGTVAAVLVVAGCGSSDSSSNGSNDGTASADLVVWAGDFCDAIRPLDEATSAFGDAASNAPDPTEVIQNFKDIFGSLGPIFRDTADGIDSLDAPPIDNGDVVKASMVDGLNTAADGFDEVADEVAGLDPKDENAFASVSTIFGSIGKDLEDSSKAVDDAFEREDMKDAFDSAPKCEGLDITG